MMPFYLDLFCGVLYNLNYLYLFGFWYYLCNLNNVSYDCDLLCFLHVCNYMFLIF
jgi:hypothetical protein